ncbi:MULTISPECIES: hypothetical protein [Bacillus]|uniref:hypothetical protein n=1 Tax=Bacillus TaxID=1386 RepID=UPI000CD8FDB3|nr:hypothetical protein [Bacillus wiedmannii]MED3077021.1 hypothetical protein [Bacillus wiedmannii]UOB98029.1 hypothetical protein BTI679_54210 [Bacillus wiedmannii]
MSLTSILKSSKERDKEFQSILRKIIPKKNEFKTVSGKTAFTKEYEMLVPYTLTNPYQASLVGTAFDYLARAMIAQVAIGNSEDFFKKINAENGLKIMKSFFKKSILSSFKLNYHYKKSIKQFQLFINGKNEINELITAACYLAKLEHIFRSGLPPMNPKKSLFSNPEEVIKKELEDMCRAFQKRFLVTEIVSQKSKVIYNPTFGIASLMVGGADGDIIIDGVLYDFKSGKALGYSWKEVAQLIGYYFLNEISVTLNSSEWSDAYKDLKIKKVAIYKARYGEVEYFDLANYDRQMVSEITNKMILHLKI